MPAQRLKPSLGASVPFLVTMMLATGVSNTILTKYQDKQCVRNCSDPDPAKRQAFEQPVLQTAQMFVGEMGCWLVVGAMALHARWQARRRRNTGYEAVASSANHDMAAPLTAGYDDEDDELGPGAVEPAVVAPSLADEVLEDVASIHHQHRGVNVLRGARVVLLALPAICDICATTLMNVGLLLIAASIWQMTRGALVLFVGLFSVVFLRRRLYAYQWLSLVGVVLGVGLVGLAGAIWPDRQTPHSSAVAVPAAAGHHAALADAAMALMARAAGAAGVAATDSNGMLQAIVGVLLVAFAQIFTATQFVLEEWILEKSSLEPIKVTGWEGVFGFLVTIVGMCILHLAVGRTPQGRYGYFDMTEGLRQMTQNRQVLISSFAIMVSIGCFNFFGLSVTRSVSATARSTIDTCRTLFIWIISLFLGWETFKWLQVVGFALLVYSTFVFNGVVRPPFKWLVVHEPDEDGRPQDRARD